MIIASCLPYFIRLHSSVFTTNSVIEIFGFEPELDSFLDQLTPKSLSLRVLPRVRALTLDPGTQTNGQRLSVFQDSLLQGS